MDSWLQSLEKTIAPSERPYAMILAEPARPSPAVASFLPFWNVETGLKWHHTDNLQPIAETAPKVITP
jgi:hypothetical protein